MHYKILALDLDGTLTNNKKEITANTITTLKKAQEKGIRIVLASGRPTFGVAPIANALELDKYEGYILSFNGGEIINWQTHHPLYRNFLDPEDLPYLYSSAKENDFTLATYMDEYVVTESPDNEYVHKMAHLNGMPIRKVNHFLEAIDHPISKCLIVGEAQRLALLEKEMQIQDRLGAFRSEPYFLELVPQGVDKASSLSILLKQTGISSEQMIAIGDGFNDLSMIRYAGMGVAMGNAQDIVKENADFITLSNEEDGVAHVVEEFIL